MVGVNDPRFIVGTGRCGSSWLSGLLARHPLLLDVSELFGAAQPDAFISGAISGKSFWRILSTPQTAWTTALRERMEPSEFRYRIDESRRFSRDSGVPPILGICLPAITDQPDELYDELQGIVPRFPTSPVGMHYRRLLEWLCRRMDRQVWVERSGGSLAYVGEIAKHFPRARFVHLHRDGCETALSMSRHTYFRMALVRDALTASIGHDLYGHRPVKADLAEVPADLKDLTPVNLEPRAFWDLEIPLERFGIRWSATILLGTNRLAALPADRVWHLSYESLIADPTARLCELLEFFELPTPPIGWHAWVRAQVRDSKTDVTELPGPVLGRLRRACSPGERRRRTLARFG